jgi:hypothetical protein
MKRKHVLMAIYVAAVLLSPAMLGAQDQGSVADAARKAQAAKKPPTKPALVIDNDTLGSIKGTISIVGETPAPPEDQTAAQDKTKATPADDKGKTPAPTKEKEEDRWRKTFADARKTLADDAHELDILQREYNLKQQQYYSDPNTAMKEQYNRQDLTDTKAKIDEKTAAVAKDKQAISDLEDQLRQAGGEPGWATAP